MRGLVNMMLAGGLLLAVVGCADKNALKKLNVDVQPDVNSLKDASGQTPTLVVDIVGAQTGDELKRFEAKPVDQWIQPSDDLKAASKRYTMLFRPGQYSPQVLKNTDPIWEEWKTREVKFVVIFANFAKAPGTAEPDPRKLVLPVTNGRWQDVELGKDDTVRVEVRRSGMTVFPPPGPEKK